MYKYVAVIGIDGMGCFNRHADTPCMDKIFSDGAVTYDALSMNPTISAQNWGGMLLGASPEVHKLTNSIVSSFVYENESLPSIFYYIRKAHPQAYLASICNWNPINHGIVEKNVGVDTDTDENDDSVCEKVIERVKKKPEFLFVQLDNVDGAGHHYGYGTKGHLDEIAHADSIVGKIYSAYCDEKMIDDTLFIVIADHGGCRRGHGGYTPDERFVFFGVAGSGVQKGTIPHAVTKDIAATVLFALGIDIPAYNDCGFSSQIPQGIFKDLDTHYALAPSTSFVPESLPTPFIDGAGGLYSFFSKDDVALAMNFDDSIGDSTGKCRITERGNVKYYSTGVHSSRGELGSTGWAEVEGLGSYRSFTAAFWLSVDLSLNDEACVFTTFNNLEGDREDGFRLSCPGGAYDFRMVQGDNSADGRVLYPENADSGYVHCLVSVSREKNCIDLYLNFKKRETINLDWQMSDFDLSNLTVGNDRIGRHNNISRNVLINMDDLFVFSRCFDETDVKRLAEYYDIKEDMR